MRDSALTIALFAGLAVPVLIGAHLLARRRNQVEILLRAHIESSKAEVRKITLHMLHQARSSLERAPAARLGTERARGVVIQVNPGHRGTVA